VLIPNLIAATFFLFTGGRLSAVDGSRTQLKELCDNKQDFELREALEAYPNDDSPELLFYRGVVSNRFNQLQASFEYLQSYLQRTKNSDDGKRLMECHETLADNYLKNYQYRKAAEAYSTILAKFRDQISEEEAADHENAVMLWKALGDVAPQTVAFNGDSKIQTTKDAAELTTLPVEINGQEMTLVIRERTSRCWPARWQNNSG
jgi:tetratricopeptide (TPR) repeat protein